MFHSVLLAKAVL